MNLNKNDIELINEEYLSNDMYKLNKICKYLIYKKNAPKQYEDDLLSIGRLTFAESLKTYNPTRNVKFQTYLISNIWKAYYDWTRDNMREKRCNFEKDAKGKIKRDQNGKPIIIHNISLNAPTEDGIDLKERIDSGFNIEEALPDEMGFSSDERVEKFMASLSDIQKEILKMKMDDKSVKMIKDSLNISNSEYNDAMAAIRENRLICLFNRGSNTITKNIGGKIEMGQTITINEDDLIMDLDTTDNHTVDARSIESLLRDKNDGELDCNYISQRDALIWLDSQINKFLSRILNNQPIPEIVVCETDESLYGEKISYLVEGLQRISYAEEFYKNRIPIKANGAEFTKIKYKNFEYDENGKIVKDENGRAKYTIDVFDIKGKYYRDLPEFLQKRFDNYNVSVTRFFNCTYELIDYHIRNYNNHEGMTKSQYGITNVSNNTSIRIKSISRKHPFFVNNAKYTNKAKKRGVLEEMVARSMMTIFFVNDWKKESIDALKYIDQHAEEEHFTHFEEILYRLANVADKSIKDMFNTTNIHIWLAAFDKFTTYDIDDKKFIEFMKEFINNLHEKSINGRSYDDVNKRNTRDKTTVKNKINVLIELMEDWFEITYDNYIVDNIEEFISECTNTKVEKIKEDIDFYNQSLDELLDNTVRIESNLRHEDNRPSLLAMMVYSYEMDVDLDNWLTEYSINNSYKKNQRENFLHMKKDLQNYIDKREEEDKKKGSAA